MRHPKALPILALTELWERFGFYIVQGLLVLYMTEYFGWSDNESYTIMGVFTALAYMAPLAGGYIANRILGYKVSVLWGGFLLMSGYFLLSLPFAKSLLFPALATIIIGNGFFKPNVSSLLGLQYSSDDPKRESAFTIFYIGINIGAFLAGISSGYIREHLGWRFSFGLACLGILIGIATFSYGLRHLVDLKKSKLQLVQIVKLAFYSLLAIIALNFLLHIHSLANWLLPIAGIILLMLMVVLTWQQDATHRRRLILLNILILSSVVFWTLFLQLFSSANLFVERLVDKDYFGFHLTSTVFWGSESVFIILLGPIFAIIWHQLALKNKNPSPILKFSLGILCAGLGFLLLSISTEFLDATNLINPLWIFAAYLLITIGELLISPIGLSAVTTLSPANLMGLMMGIWFVATGFGGIFAGIIAKFSSVPASAVTLGQKLEVYQSAFLTYAYFAFVVAILLFFLHLVMQRVLKRDRVIGDRLS